MQSLATATPRGSAGDDPVGGILRTSSVDHLRLIRRSDVELVLWERSLAPDLARWLDGLPIRRLPHGRMHVRAAHLTAALTDLVEAAEMPRECLRDAFLEDVGALARSFMSTMGVESVDLRLETIGHNACWRFHRDCVAARLLTTYRGPGTEWVLPGDSDRALSRQSAYRGPTQRFARHAVGLFKGSCSAPASGVVHRSPAIAGTGTTRLFLCLNLPSPSSPDRWDS